jgi:peptidoglycan hydrolase CwlO-like protein
VGLTINLTNDIMKRSTLYVAAISFVMILIFSISFAIHTSTAQTTVEFRGDDGDMCNPEGNSCIVVTAPRL